MFQRILLPLDGSPLAECTVPHALALAQLADAELILLHVLARQGGERSVDPLQWHLRQAAAQSTLDQTQQRLAASGVRSSSLLVAGSPTQSILEQAAKLNVDLIAISSHGQSGRIDATLGAVAHRLVARVSTSLLLVRTDLEFGGAGDFVPARYRTLLLPLDGSRRAESLLPIAARLATIQDAELVLAHVVHRPLLLGSATLPADAQALAKQAGELNLSVAELYLVQLQERQEIPTRLALAQADNVGTALLQLSEQHQADLVLVTAHGAGVNPLRPVGDTVSSLLAYSPQPVLVYQDRPSGQASQPREAPVQARASVYDASHMPFV
jgi:nucleotide-binding universal stress UspA family protein